ncbi:MAG: Rrf2 family transcriptional regulator [Anaerolineales bacterium]
MLKINRQTDYAVRVILSLSRKEPNTRVSTSEIGREMLIPAALLQRIIADLASGGFIRTQTGRDGGISLARDPQTLNLLEIVEHFEGELFLSDCILKPGECHFEPTCPVHCQWVRLKDLLRAEMARITFTQLVEEGKQLQTSLEVGAAVPLPMLAL